MGRTMSAARRTDVRPPIPPARFRYLVDRIHPLGPRPLLELLAELEAGAELSSVLERCARLSPLADFIATLDGDCLPPVARLVSGGGRR